MSFSRWGAAPLVAGVLLLAGSAAHAGELDACRTQARATGLRVADPDLGLAPTPAAIRDAVPLGELELIEDFHPETDRWTDRNNRIRLTGWFGGWFPSGELRLEPAAVIGFRINWEVPGFIAIRWDSGFVPWAQLKVHDNAGAGGSGDYEHAMGLVHNHNLSIGIFNPELSVDGLAFWAGFGLGVWVYSFDDDDVDLQGAPSATVSFSETDGIMGDEDALNIGGNLFIELDYEIADVFHVGLGLRQHVILADHTNLGRFYDVNGVLASAADGRNEGQFDDLAGVTEITLNFSILF